MSWSRVYYHLVWATKLREPLITDQNRDALLRSISAKIGQLDGISHGINAMPDHVHLLATIPLKLSIAVFVQRIKGSASHHMGQLFGVGFFWQDDYGALTVSESHVDYVKAYIRDQAQHHANRTLRDDLESF